MIAEILWTVTSVKPPLEEMEHLFGLALWIVCYYRVVLSQLNDASDPVNTSQEEKFAMIIKEYEAQCRVWILSFCFWKRLPWSFNNGISMWVFAEVVEIVVN